MKRELPLGTLGGHGGMPSMLLMPLMRMTPPFWMPELPRSVQDNEESVASRRNGRHGLAQDRDVLHEVAERVVVRRIAIPDLRPLRFGA